MTTIATMKPHELARRITELSGQNPAPEREMQDMMEELLCLVDEEEARRLLRQAQSPRIN